MTSPQGRPMRRFIAVLFMLIFTAGTAMADLREAVNTLGKVKLDGLAVRQHQPF